MTSTIHPFTEGTVANPLPTTTVACPKCGGELHTAWNPVEALLSSMFSETAGLVRVVCLDGDCGWQGSAKDAKA